MFALATERILNDGLSSSFDVFILVHCFVIVCIVVLNIVVYLVLITVSDLISSPRLKSPFSRGGKAKNFLAHIFEKRNMLKSVKKC